MVDFGGLGDKVAGFVVDQLVGPIFRLVTAPVILVYNWKTNVANLENKVETLVEKQGYVDRHIDAMERTGQVRTKHQSWLAQTEKVILASTEDKKLKKKKEKAEMKYFCGLCRNPVSLYKLSKIAVENVESIVVQLTEADEKLDLPTAYDLVPAQRATASPVAGFQDFPSRKGVLEKIMSALENTRVNRVGLHGMAGSGKSMMVKEVRRKAEEVNMFERVVLVKVTMKPDLERIRDELARGLGMTQLSVELTSQRVTDMIKAKLEILAEKGKVLFILDDIWEKIDLEEIGISFPETDQSGEECFKWKILFTSRDRNVFHDDIDAEQVFAIGKIKPLEAENMFVDIVGKQVLTGGELESTVKQIILECGRLPLAIATMAHALKGRDLHEWSNALTKLRSPSPHNFSGVSRSIYAAIEMSYSRLESNELKQVFLLSGMMGPNFSLESLLKYGIGLGLFPQAYTIEEAQADLLTLINHLKAAALLIEGSNSGGNSFDMHDITRVVAISIAHKDHDGLLLKDSHEPKEWHHAEAMKRFRWILLQNSDVNELPQDFQSSNLVFFGMLNKDRCCLEIPDNFFTGMSSLGVLHLCQMDHLSPLPSSICFLKNLHTLSLEESELEEGLSYIGELKSLEILSLSGSNFASLPEEIRQLTRLKSLDLSNCDKLKVIPAHVLGKLSKLEELYLANSFVQWEREVHRGAHQERASLAELKNLKKLTALEVCIGDIQMIPTGLLFENLKKYKIYIGKSAETNHVDDYFDSARMVKLQLNAPLSVDYSVKEQLFNNTEELYLEGLNHVENVISELYDEGFQHLRYLSVKNAPDVHQIITTEEMFPLNAFPALEELFLHELISLEKVFHGSVMEKSLTKLTKITVGFCKQVQTLFSSSIALQLVELQQIDVQHCDKMKAVVDDEEERGRHDFIATGSPKFGEQLRSLRLQHLPQLVGFSRSCNNQSLFNDQVVISNLEEMMLSSIHVTTIWSTPSSSFVEKLVNLVIEGCDNLQYLFPLSMARGLENLRFLRIRGCKNMEKVISTLDGDDNEKLIFPKLESLHISGLQKLVEFYEGNCAIEFPSLKLLNISNCQEMKRFVTNPTTTDEDAFFTKTVEFSVLESMCLSGLKCLTKIWHYQHFKPSFCKLKSLVVSYCANLGTIFPSIDMRETSLELIKIKGCNSVQVVFEIGDHNVGSTGHDQGRDIQLKEIDIENLPELKHVWDKDPQGMLSFGNLETVSVSYCPNTRHVFPVSIAKSLLQLQKLHLWDNGMEEIVAASRIGATSDSEQVVKFNFPQLSSLTLGELSKLNCFYPGKHLIVWPMLKEFEFSRTFVSAKKKRETDDGLGKLDFPVDLPLFPLKQVIHRFRKISLSEGDTKMISQRHFKGDPFSNIKQLSMSNFYSASSAVFSIPFLQKCCSLEDLVVGNSNFKELFPSNVETFSKIKKLRIHQCRNLIHLWSQDSSHVLPNLEDLEVDYCDRLISLSTSSKASFWINLTTLEVTYCKRMKNLVSPSTARNLTQLLTLTIAFCGALTEVVGNKEEEEEDGARDSAIIFKKLRYLKLKGLTRMTSFCSGNFNFEFPSLKQVIVEQCPHLKIFCEGNIKAPELHGVKAPDLRWHYDLNKTIQAMCKEEVGYARLENLELSAFPQLIKIWHNGNPQEKLDFGRLERLRICNCNDLSYLLTTSMALSLVLLKKLVVENCGVIEQVIKGSNEAQDQVIIFQLLREIGLENCSILTSFYKGSDNGLKFPALDLLVTKDCPEMVTFADFTSSGDHEEEAPQAQCFFGNKVALPELMTLRLKDMPSISKIWEDDFDVPSGCAKNCLEELNLSEYPKGVPFGNQELQGILSFKMLTSICFRSLPNLRYALTPSMALGLEQLEEFRVINCEAIEQVIADTGEGSQRMLFPKMELLVLQDLPSLTSFGSGNSFEFPSLTYLRISKCPLLKTFISSSGISQDSIVSSGKVDDTSSRPPLFDAKVAFPKLESLIIEFMESLNKIWDDQLDANSFYQLDNINVEACNKLSYIFSLSMVGRLQKLNKMEIWGCNSVVEIFGSSQSQSHVMEITPIKLVFPELTSMSLRRLPELKCFFPQIHTIECPSMRILEVKGCNKIQILASEFQSTMEDNQLEIVDKCSLFWVTKATFSSIEELKLENNGLMEEIWHGQNNQVNDDIVFSKLKSLKLNQLPKLSTFCSSNRKFEFPTLEDVTVMGCPRMEFFSMQESLTPKVPSVKWVANEDDEDHQGLWKDNLNATIQEMFTQKVGYSTLEELNLSDYKELIPIWNQNPGGILSFKMLTLLEVCNLDNLIYALTPSMALGLEQLMEFRVVNCEAIEQVIADTGEGSQRMLFPKMELLVLQDLPSLTRFGSGNSFEFPSLTYLRISKCPLLKTFISSSGISQDSIVSSGKVDDTSSRPPLFDAKVAFPKLESLIIEFMESLNKIWDDQLDANSFYQLDNINVEACNKLSYIFSLSMVGRLQKLNKMEIWGCNSVVEIFGSSQSQSHVMEITPIKLVFPELTSMSLRRLPELKCFFPQIHTIECPSMRILEVKGCNKIQILASEFQSTMEDNQLEIVDKCSLFWVTKATFSSIEELKLENNGLMEEIWHGQNNQVNDDIVFSKLKSLKLNQLPKLSTFCSSNRKFEFPTLEDVTVMGCPRMEFFSMQESLTPKVPSVKWVANEDDEDHQGLWKDNLNATIQEMFTQKVGYSTLEELNLSDYKELIPIWNQNPGGILSFKMLTLLEVCNLDNLIYALTPSMALGLEQLMEFRVVNCEAIEQVIADTGEGSQRMLFPKMETLELQDLPNLTRFGSGNSFEFPSLTHLEISKCPLLKTFISSSGISQDSIISSGKVDDTSSGPPLFDAKVAFPKLESLIIEFMESLNKIWDDQLDANSFYQLDNINVEACNKLSYIFSLSMVGRLQKLNKMEIWGCNSVVEIFGSSQSQSHVMEITPIKLVFPELTSMSLRRLPELKCFFPQIHTIECPSMRILEVKGCNKIQILASEFQSTMEDNQLEIVDKCSLFWVTKATFSSIEELKLENNGLMEEIWHGQNNQVNDDIVFSKLKSLKLNQLPKLSTFCSSNRKFEFPTLEDVTVMGCPRMEFFSMQESLTPKVPSVKWVANEDDEDHQGLWKDNLNATIQEMFTQKVGYSTLEELNLSDYKELIPIWNQNPGGILSFKMLTLLEVCNLDNLIYALTPSMALGLEQLMEFRVVNCEAIEQVIADTGEGSQRMLFPKMETLELQDLPNLTRFGSGNSFEFPSLTHLEISKCPLLKTFISSSGISQDSIISSGKVDDTSSGPPLFDAKVAFPKLESLIFEFMESLNKIWDDQLDANSFYQLDNINVEDCNKLVYIFPLSMVGRLQTLNKMEIWGCNSLVEIFGSSQSQSYGMEITPIKLVFPKLTSMSLRWLPELKCFFPQIHTIECPSMTTLEVKRCHKIQILASEFRSAMEDNQLEIVDKCSLFWVTKATFSSIEELKLENNGLMEEIWHGQNNQVNDDIVFSKLKSLKLNQLLKLASFCSSNRKFEFPTLEDVTVMGCPRMELFSMQESLTPKVPSVKWVANEDDEDHQGLWKGDLNATIQEMFAQKVGYSTLEELNLSEYKELIPIWNQSPGGILSFKMLTLLEVCNLPNLRYALTPSMALGLEQLEDFRVTNCEAIEQVIADTGEGSQGMLFSKMETLVLEDLSSLTSFGSGNSFEFPSLTHLEISKCSLLKTFISNSGISQDSIVSSGKVEDTSSGPPLFDAKVAFPKLESLIIEFMESLNKIWDDQLDANSFCQLDYINVDSCNKLQYIFPLSMLERLQTLDSLEIWSCDLIEEIIHPHGRFGSQSVIETPIKLVFSKLTHLDLYKLPKLKCFFPQTHIIEFPSMTELEVNGCDQIQILACAKEDNQLEILDKCSLFWVTKATFPVLKEATLGWSESMEEIWHGQHPKDYFPELQLIKLKYFPEQFVESQSSFFQSLPKLVVNDEDSDEEETSEADES